MLRSKLAHFGRPVVVFDPCDLMHRQWLVQFMNTHAWGHCPVRFTVQEEGDLVASMQKQLINYYASREFGMQGLDKACA